MNIKKVSAVTVAALVLGLALGNIASAGAATTTDATGTVASTVASCGLRIGASVRDAGGRLVDIVATLTGQSVEDVQAERADGKTFEQIAEAEGVSIDSVVDKALAVRKDVLDAKVKSGDITQEQADTAIATMEDRLTDRMDSTAACGGGAGGSCGGMGGGKGRGGMGGGGMGGGNCNGAGVQQ